MTETSPVSCQTRIDDDLERRTTTIGRTHLHVEHKVIEPSHRERGRPRSPREIEEFFFTHPDVEDVQIHRGA